MPFLRLTRDRRGFENTFLMHADRPGDRPRLLYWYRTAPGVMLGRSALDEDAIRTIEEQHPDIEFDWPAILALSEVMTPEEEEPIKSPPASARKSAAARRAKEREPRPDAAREPSDAARAPSGELRRDDHVEEISNAVAPIIANMDDEETDRDDERLTPPHPHVSGLLEELVGREIATRLRARYSEIQARIHEQPVDAAQRNAWLKRAEALNPDLWLTPDAILDGVRHADHLFDTLRAELQTSRE